MSARAEDYDVFVAIDASGTFSADIREACHKRLVLHGCQMVSSFAIISELYRDWRNKGDRHAYLCVKYLPAYATVMQSYNALTKKQ
jgi:hypothetical protein